MHLWLDIKANFLNRDPFLAVDPSQPDIPKSPFCKDQLET